MTVGLNAPFNDLTDATFPGSQGRAGINIADFPLTWICKRYAVAGRRSGAGLYGEESFVYNSNAFGVS